MKNYELTTDEIKAHYEEEHKEIFYIFFTEKPEAS